MKKFLIAVTALSAAALVTTAVLAQQARPVQPPMRDDRSCLQVDRVENWNIVNSSTMVVTDKAKHAFRVGLSGNCAPSHFYDQVIFRPLASSSIGCVASGDRVNLSARNGQVERCVIRSVTIYTDAQRRIDERTARAAP